MTSQKLIELAERLKEATAEMVKVQEKIEGLAAPDRLLFDALVISAAPEKKKRKRKQRSDKGGTRKPRKAKASTEEAEPAKATAVKKRRGRPAKTKTEVRTVTASEADFPDIEL